MTFQIQNPSSPSKRNFEWWEPEKGSLSSSFCLESSLHGLRFIGQPKRHMVERIFWSIAFLTSVSLAVTSIVQIWNKYEKTPVITIFRPSEININSIPFPAVTICNSNNVIKQKAELFISRALESNDNAVAYNDLFMLDHVCETSTTFSERFNFSLERGAVNNTVRQKVLDFRKNYPDRKQQSKPFLQLLNDVAQKCNEMIRLCMWNDEVRNCSELFDATETDFGYCCTFNMVPTSTLLSLRNDIPERPGLTEQWDNLDLNFDKLVKDDVEEDGNDENDDEEEEHMANAVPRKQFRPGKSSGLSVLLDPDIESYFCTNTDSIGFVALAHGTVEFPRISDNGLAIRPNSEVFLKIRPDITVAEKSIKNFPLEKRKCYFGTEFSLKYYKYYSTSNCEDECMANLTFSECKCVRYFMPRSDTQKICGPNQFQCSERVRKKIVQQGIRKRCKVCLPTCTEIEYHMTSSYIPMRTDIPVWEYPNGTNASWVDKNVTILHVHFSIDSTYPKLRKELYGFLDLLSSTGGLLGLCLGFSVLSLLEIFYFITLRACCLSQHGRQLGTRINEVSGSAWKSAYETVTKSWKLQQKSTDDPYGEIKMHPPLERSHFFGSHRQISQESKGFNDLPYYVESHKTPAIVTW